jgi:hypothetical protein
MMKLFITFLFLHSLSFAQEWKSISVKEARQSLENFASSYRATNYSIHFSVEMYENNGDLLPRFVRTGNLHRGNAKEYYSSQNESLTIQNNDYKIIVDSLNKQILLMKPDSLFDAISMNALFSAVDFNESQFLERSSKEGKAIRVLPPTGSSGYNCYEIYTDVSGKNIVKIVLFSVAQNYFGSNINDETLESPKTVVNYSVPRKLSKAEMNTLFLSENYLNLQNKGEVKSSIAYTGYIINDLRIQNNKTN